MGDKADLAFVVTTWLPAGMVGAERINAASLAINSWIDQTWGYDSFVLVVADDGSPERHTLVLATTLPRSTVVVQSPRFGCGGALNKGVSWVLDSESADIIFYAQDDWTIDGVDLDLRPSLALLNSGTADVVRLGPTHPNLRANVTRTDIPDAEWCLEYDWSGGGYVVGWRPALYHRRVFERFPLDGLEGLSAIEGERLWLERMAAMRPRVFHAPNCTLAGPFRHIETVELGEDSPSDLDARYRE